jgi:predicted Ser/Thr protein kinase
VGGGKSSLAERLKALMEVHPITSLKPGTRSVPFSRAHLACLTRTRWAWHSRIGTVSRAAV